MKQTALERYKIMWIIVLFDLPTNTPKERKQATTFRKDLIRDGFYMLQYSVYIRSFPSREAMNVHVKRIRKILPTDGQITIMTITDKQYADILNYFGRKTEPLQAAPEQLEMF